MKRFAGFTMVEMMAVIAVITILALMAIPSYLDKIVNNYVSALAVQDGVIHLTFGNRASKSIAGKTLSLRPAIVEDAPMVPITWVCGFAEAPGKMTALGSDRTTVDPAYLPMECRALKPSS